MLRTAMALECFWFWLRAVDIPSRSHLHIQTSFPLVLLYHPTKANTSALFACATLAAKQAAFEEAAKFKNQFRALDDDEVEFLDDIRSSVRADEERLRRETREGLDAFRAAQREREREAALAGGDEGDGATDGADGAEGWAVAAGRKRKREKERVIKGVKRRASDLDRGGGDGRGGEEKEKDEKQNEENDVVQRRDTEGDQAVAQRLDKNAPASQAQRSHQGTKPKLGLVDYGSDDDDDD